MNPMSEQEFQDFARQANWFMRGQIEDNKKAFELDSFHRFDWDQWRGELAFSSGGVPKVVARIQIVGNFSTKADAWTWAWANNSYLFSVRQAALRTKEFGTERGIVRLMQPRWAAKETDAWEMSAVTAKLIGAKGAFKSPSPDGFTFFVFTDIRTVSDRKRIFGAQTCSHVLDEEKPILLVSKETNGEVLAVCGGENDTPETLRNVTLERLLDLDSTLSALADLPDGWAAQRESADEDWARVQAG